MSLKAEVSSSKWDKDGNFQPVRTTWFEATAETDWDGAGQVLATLMAPASQAQIMEWLTLCSALTASAGGSAGMGELTLKAMGGKLQAYPGDCVRKALEDWPDDNTFFPKWRELKSAIEAVMGDRAALVEAARERTDARQPFKRPEQPKLAHKPVQIDPDKDARLKPGKPDFSFNEPKPPSRAEREARINAEKAKILKFNQ